jgi:hypothetical protein
MAERQDIKIEKGIPMPSAYRAGKWVKIMRQMEVGDSFLATAATRIDARKLQINIRGCSRVIKDKKYATRMVAGGVRMWRTE